MQMAMSANSTAAMFISIGHRKAIANIAATPMAMRMYLTNFSIFKKLKFGGKAGNRTLQYEPHG